MYNIIIEITRSNGLKDKTRVEQEGGSDPRGLGQLRALLYR